MNGNADFPDLNPAYFPQRPRGIPHFGYALDLVFIIHGHEIDNV
jgi:hypothetical protein